MECDCNSMTPSFGFHHFLCFFYFLFISNSSHHQFRTRTHTSAIIWANIAHQIQIVVWLLIKVRERHTIYFISHGANKSFIFFLDFFVALPFFCCVKLSIGSCLNIHNINKTRNNLFDNQCPLSWALKLFSFSLNRYFSILKIIFTFPHMVSISKCVSVAKKVNDIATDIVTH